MPSDWGLVSVRASTETAAPKVAARPRVIAMVLKCMVYSNEFCGNQDERNLEQRGLNLYQYEGMRRAQSTLD